MVGAVKAVTEHLVGHVDNSSFPSIAVDIQMDLTLPAAVSKPAPVMIVLTWTGKWMGPPIPAGDDPDWREQLLSKGWGYAEYVPTSVQADNAEGLMQGIIGLANKGGPRKLDDWGALRAWAWGVSRAIDYLDTDARVDPHRIGVEGHSRYGKAALVAEAYDPRIAMGYISSSGAGGAKLLRRNFGEQVENLAGGEHYWFAGNFIKYAGPKTVDELPVDAHELIALCAPRPVFVSAGTREAGRRLGRSPRHVPGRSRGRSRLSPARPKGPRHERNSPARHRADLGRAWLPPAPLRTHPATKLGDVPRLRRGASSLEALRRRRSRFYFPAAWITA